ncbi:hypothetical protein D9M69_688420 [compost metagenome]
MSGISSYTSLPARNQGPLAELHKKTLLCLVQQVAIALADPRQCALKVVQVVVAVGGKHGLGWNPITDLLYSNWSMGAGLSWRE